MNNLQEKIKQIKKQAISIKYLAKLSEINISTLYSFTSGQRNLSKEKQEKLNNILNMLLNKQKEDFTL